MACGTNSPQNLNQVISYINNLEATGTIASTTNTEYEIPINLILVTDAGGGFYFNYIDENEIITEFNQALEVTNSYFTDNYHFSLCTNVVSAPAPTLQSVNLNNNQDILGLQSVDYSTTAVNCYVVNDVGGPGIIGQAQFPFYPAPNNFIAIEYNSFAVYGEFVTENLGTLLAHELGHYLGLIHSNNFAAPNDDCATSGDLMCSTPPDPFGMNNASCTGNCDDGFDCAFPPLGYVYDNFIRNNVMVLL